MARTTPGKGKGSTHRGCDVRSRNASGISANRSRKVIGGKRKKEALEDVQAKGGDLWQAMITRERGVAVLAERLNVERIAAERTTNRTLEISQANERGTLVMEWVNDRDIKSNVNLPQFLH